MGCGFQRAGRDRAGGHWPGPRQPPVLLPTGMSNHEAFLRVDAGYRMPCPQGCPPTAHRLMLWCWHKDPEQRPSFQALREKLSSSSRYESPL